MSDLVQFGLSNTVTGRTISLLCMIANQHLVQQSSGIRLCFLVKHTGDSTHGQSMICCTVPRREMQAV